MEINQQPPEKPDYSHDGSVELHHIFETVQGEGPFVGTPAVFIRLAGCSLQCPFCDTDYTSQRKRRSPYDLEKRVEELADGRPLMVVITGGEPFRQDIGPLVTLLHDCGWVVQIETNGVNCPPNFPFDKATIVCSPKTGKINKKLAPHIDALKYVLHADMIDTDGLPTRALNHPASPHTARIPDDFIGEVYVQPIDVEDEAENTRHTEATVRVCQQHGYRLCLQTHKMIGLE